MTSVCVCLARVHVHRECVLYVHMQAKDVQVDMHMLQGDMDMLRLASAALRCMTARTALHSMKAHAATHPSAQASCSHISA